MSAAKKSANRQSGAGGAKASRPAASPKQIRGSTGAKRKAAAILEVLAGVLTPTEGAAALELALARYYVLEARALGAMVAALEPRARGGQRSRAKELAEIVSERDRLRGEVARLSALLRATERVVGLPGQAAVAGKRRRTEPRGARVVRALRPPEKESSS